MNESVSKNHDNPPAESQQERWMKYGGNVVLVTVIVIAIAAVVVYIAERRTRRLDTTSSGLYSLKPQTVNVIKDNKQKIQITSLYTKTKPGAIDEAKPAVADQAEKVADLLEEYKTKGKNIEVDSIDPVSNPTKADDLINEVTSKYGGQVDKYKTFAKTYVDKYKALADEGAAEVKQLESLLNVIAKEPPKDESLSTALRQLLKIRTFYADLPSQVQPRENLVQRVLKTKPIKYKAIADDAVSGGGDIADNTAGIITYYNAMKAEAKVPEPMKKYMIDAVPRLEALKKDADKLVAEAQGLGELKLDTLYDALHQPNSILVRGESEWKIIPYEQVWRAENRSGASEAAKLKPRFAGEQMITTAILGLQQPKKLKVAFVRAGGAPLAEPPIPMFRPDGGPFGVVAERLREYNYDVVEKDLTGMWAMQQMQQQQGMSAPEPSDAEIKDAVWVVIDVPGQQSQFGPAPTIAPKVAEHLANGGSALILATPRADDLSAALKDWGITIRTDAMLVHDQIKSEGAPADMIEQVKKNPMFFEVRDWGAHPITSAMRSLPGIFFHGVPIVTSAAKDVKVTPLIPIPDAPAAPKSWGDTEAGNSREGPPTFKPDKDLAGPLFGGAAAEKKDGGRVVVLGSADMMVSQVVNFLDPELAQKEVYVVRFPGNGELFSNAVYWLSKQETMIAISPASMDVGRIENLSAPARNVWGIILFAGLPLLVIAAGALVFMARRD